MKFKKEEKIHKNLIDLTLCGFDFNKIKHEINIERTKLEKLEKQKKT